ncbi:MAG TPA: hypothetical protein VE398_21640 [Acidobacteriota bacterium]|nr:hypothetical protein [Acidobacteriota bacterium]
MLRRIGFVIASLAGVYFVFIAGLLILMLQTPARFSLGMAKIPEPLFAAVPFRRLWTFARMGHLRIGEAAPDFHLDSLDGKSQVRLSSFRGEKLVVLVFGSYT